MDSKGTCRCSLTVGYERLIKHSTVDLNSLPTSASKPSAFDLFSWPFFLRVDLVPASLLQHDGHVVQS